MTTQSLVGTGIVDSDGQFPAGDPDDGAGKWLSDGTATCDQQKALICVQL